jgi:hypothetical protein
MDFDRRKKEHLHCKYTNYPFQNALRRNPDDFVWEVWSDDCEYPVLEQALLDMWVGKKWCYNINPSATHPPSPRGRVDTEETRKRRSEAQRGKKHSPDTIEKLRAINKEKGVSPALLNMQKNPKTGKEHPKSRPLLLINLDTGKEEKFDCVTSAAKKYDLNKSHLCAVARGERKKHKGYRAKYL